MRFLFVATACAACATPAATPDAPSGFTFTVDYTFASNITSATFGSATFTADQTLHVERSYASYAASQSGSDELVDVMAYGQTATFIVRPWCGDCLGAGTPYSDVESDTVEWPVGSDGLWFLGQYSCSATAGIGCAGTIN